MLPLSLILPPVLIAFLYPSLRSINAITTISGRNKALDVSGRVLLVTAHPDDEAMFFSPTITALTKNTNTELYTVCISTGDMDGDAEQRSAELQRSLDVFGVAPARRWILDEPRVSLIASISGFSCSFQCLGNSRITYLQDGMPRPLLVWSVLLFTRTILLQYVTSYAPK